MVGVGKADKYLGCVRIKCLAYQSVTEVYVLSATSLALWGSVVSLKMNVGDIQWHRLANNEDLTVANL